MLGTCIVLPWRGSAHIALLLPLQLYQLSVTLLLLLLLLALVLPWRVWLSLAVANCGVCVTPCLDTTVLHIHLLSVASCGASAGRTSHDISSFQTNAMKR